MSAAKCSRDHLWLHTGKQLIFFTLTVGLARVLQAQGFFKIPIVANAVLMAIFG